MCARRTLALWNIPGDREFEIAKINFLFAISIFVHNFPPIFSRLFDSFHIFNADNILSFHNEFRCWQKLFALCVYKYGFSHSTHFPFLSGNQFYGIEMFGFLSPFFQCFVTNKQDNKTEKTVYSNIKVPNHTSFLLFGVRINAIESVLCETIAY